MPADATMPIEGAGRHDGNGRVEAAVREILLEIGEDPERQGLQGTPERVHRMYTELTAGYHVDPDRLINGAIFDVAYSEMVIVKDIPFYSLCEHHLLPFFGRAAVAYIPRGRVIGLSKIPRVVEMYSRRLQVQERLTQQIADFLQERLEPQGVGVVHGGDPSVRGDARGAQAGHGDDHVRGARPVPDARPDTVRVPGPPREELARVLRRGVHRRTGRRCFASDVRRTDCAPTVRIGGTRPTTPPSLLGSAAIEPDLSVDRAPDPANATARGRLVAPVPSETTVGAESPGGWRRGRRSPRTDRSRDRSRATAPTVRSVGLDDRDPAGAATDLDEVAVGRIGDARRLEHGMAGPTQPLLVEVDADRRHRRAGGGPARRSVARCGRCSSRA